VVDPYQAFGGQSNNEVSKSLHLFKYPSFSVTIVEYHTEVVTFYRPWKWLFLLVKLCVLSETHHSLKSLCIIKTQKVWRNKTRNLMKLTKIHVYILKNPYFDICRRLLIFWKFSEKIKTFFASRLAFPIQCLCFAGIPKNRILSKNPIGSYWGRKKCSLSRWLLDQGPETKSIGVSDFGLCLKSSRSHSEALETLSSLLT